ncbi:uncharacterized protein LOC141653278 [Silene latifolia]|uniref:uncharacterized protein LOC141653278 n=1 Tax=Silene latifolia TaxID=37657 RepID=UPI003D77EB09
MPNNGSIHRRYGREIKVGFATPPAPGRYFQHFKKIPDEAESNKMYLRCLQWKISGVHDDPERDRGQHRTDQSNSAAGVTAETKRRTTPDWKSGNSKQVYIPILGQMQVVLRHTQERPKGLQDDGVPRGNIQRRINLHNTSTPIPEQEAEVVCITSSEEETPDWRKPYQDWLQNNTLPIDKKEVRSFRMKASRFILIDGVLFRNFLAGPYLRCLDREESQAVLHALHSGECGNLAGGKSLSKKAMRQRYFWPTMRKDPMEFAKKCDDCQRHAHVSHQPAEPLHLVISPRPFMKWGMDIVGPLPKEPGNKVYMLAMTDNFSKLIEAESSSQVTETQVISFIKRNIICRFGIPPEIIYDNGSQFIGNKTEAFRARWNISLQKSTPRNPQSNGQAKSSNKIIVENLKKKLEEIRGQ